MLKNCSKKLESERKRGKNISENREEKRKKPKPCPFRSHMNLTDLSPILPFTRTDFKALSSSPILITPILPSLRGHDDTATPALPLPTPLLKFPLLRLLESLGLRSPPFHHLPLCSFSRHRPQHCWLPTISFPKIQTWRRLLTFLLCATPSPADSDHLRPAPLPCSSLIENNSPADDDAYPRPSASPLCCYRSLKPDYPIPVALPSILSRPYNFWPLTDEHTSIVPTSSSLDSMRTLFVDSVPSTRSRLLISFDHNNSLLHLLRVITTACPKLNNNCRPRAQALLWSTTKHFMDAYNTVR